MRRPGVLFYMLLVPVLAVFVFPYVWMTLNSFRTTADIYAYPPTVTARLTWENFRAVFEETPFLRYTANSVVVTAGAVLLGLGLGLPAAYGIARSGRGGLAVWVLVWRMFPGISFLVPWFVAYRVLGLLDTYTGLVAAHLVITVPLITWVMLAFFEDVPIEIEEAARIDGCSPLGVFLRVALPLVRPGVLSASMLGLVFTWNHFLFPLILAGDRTKTLPVVVYNFMTFEELKLGGVFASASLIVLPIVVVVLAGQKYFVSGLTAGGLKG
ncbi:MAG: carbohydrate ABC transporter permease [Armatimonadota bacterium]|nr:carbohydrate ABC transporter permease [Armatimonadota bacterium]